MAALALTGMAVPVALSGSASAKAPSTAPPVVTKCAPATATIGKTVTLHGTGLAAATSVSFGTKATTVPGPFKPDKAKTLKVVVPTGVSTKKADNVTVTTANGTSTAVQCTFQKAKSKK